MIVGVSGPVVLVQRWGFFHPSREVSSSDAPGQRATEVLFVTWTWRIVVLVAPVIPLVVIQCSFGGPSTAIFRGRAFLPGGFGLLILPVLPGWRTRTSPPAAISSRWGP